MGGFAQIALTGVGEVNVTQGERHSLTVGARADLVGHVVTEVKGGILYLGLDDEGRHMRPRLDDCTFVITAPAVTGLSLSGRGSIYASGLNTDRLTVRLDGAGDIDVDSLTAEELVAHLGGVGNVEVAGQVGTQDVQVSGAGTYRAGGLRSAQARLEVGGSGDLTLWVTERLQVHVAGSASVKYYGSPDVVRHRTSARSLIPLGAPEQGTKNVEAADRAPAHPTDHPLDHQPG